MAAKDLDSDVIKRKELDDMTTCCLCIEVFKDPKALPCIHTFCMKCLQETGLKNNKGPGDEMPCPICRRMFKIPSDGFHGLPKNFFIENLIQVANVSDKSGPSRAALCDACLDENNGDSGKEIPEADTFCVDCNQKFCEECCRQHRRLRLTKNHKLIQIDGDQNVVTDLVPNVCELHEQKVLDVYCADCKTVVCAICFIEKHKNHEGSHVTQFVDGFRKQIESNAEAINECKSKTEATKAKIVKVKEDIQKRVENLECDVEKRKDELRQFTERHAASLLQDLCSIRQSKMKDIQLATDDIDTYLSSLETYNSYCQTIVAKGSASDIFRAFSDLSLRALELKEQCQPMIEREIQSFNFCFRKSELEQFLEECCDNLIGEIEEEGYPKPKKRSKESQLEEESNKIDLLNKEIEIGKTEKDNLTLSIEQLRSNIDTEIQANKALREELDKDKADYDSRTEKLNRELDENKVTISSLQADKYKLKQELDSQYMTNNSLQVDIGQLRNELDKEEIAKDSLQIDKDKLKQDLEKEKLTNNSLQTNIDQLKQELDKERFAKASLQTDKDKIKQDLDEEKSTTNSLTTSKKELVDEMNMNKTTLKTLEDKVEKLTAELKTMKTDSRTKILDLEEKLKQAKAKLRYTGDPVFVKKIETKVPLDSYMGSHALAMTILDEELFVAGGKRSEVEVFDTTQLSFSRQWNLKELIHPRDIASCNRNKCLYIFDYKGGSGRPNEILRVDPSGKIIRVWSTGDNWGYGMSVTSEMNVILAVYNKDKLCEYSPDGELIRQITLSSDPLIFRPRHAIKLSNGHFIVCHSSDTEQTLHRVCIVDANGELKASFGGNCENEIGQLNYPVHLSVDGAGFVMVADSWNCRVLILDSNLKFKRVIIGLSREKLDFQRPERILLNESSGRLFVGACRRDIASTALRVYTLGTLGRRYHEILIFDL